MKKIKERQADNGTKPHVSGSLPKEEELYYEYSFRKHFYKFERPDVGYICVADENKNVALAKMFGEIRSRLQ